ncbi:MAG: hypothetical protein SH821_13360, partial [Phototrophicales bacterium]|nr:hypothetical protein [Phototrophicales bacterium]
MQKSRQLPFGLGLRHNYKDYLDRQRAISMLYFMLVVGISMVVLLSLNIVGALLSRTAILPRDYIPLALIFFAFLVTYLVQNGRLIWAARLIVVASFIFLTVTQQTSSILTWS